MYELRLTSVSTSLNNKIYSQKYFTQILLICYRCTFKTTVFLVGLNSFLFKLIFSSRRFYFMLIIFFYFKDLVIFPSNVCYFRLGSRNALSHSLPNFRLVSKYKIPVLRSHFIYKKSVEHYSYFFSKCFWFVKIHKLNCFTSALISKLNQSLFSFSRFSFDSSLLLNLRLWPSRDVWSIV